MRIHGGVLPENTEMLDFSANINPLGMPDSVRDAIMQSAAECVYYPDPYCNALIQRISDYEQFPALQIVCGNGAADLIYRIAHAFHPRNALICAPTFSEYAFALREVGCTVHEYYLHNENHFVLDDSFLSYINDNTELVILCTPNNPTGQLIVPEMLSRIAEKCRKYDVLLVCDECFLRFVEHAERYSLHCFMHSKCIILNAFTKLYAMPGIRLGYALCGDVLLADRLRQTGQYWSVSVPAQAAGIAALDVKNWIPDTVQYVNSERDFLTQSLRSSGFFVYDGAANFLLIHAPSDFAEHMEKYCIRVRKCTDFHGLSDNYFRIAVRTHNENIALISAVREVYK